jgi:hypothetical protein
MLWTGQHVDGGTRCLRQTDSSTTTLEPPHRATVNQDVLSGRYYPVYPPIPESPELNRFNCALSAALPCTVFRPRTPLRGGYISPPLKGHPLDTGTVLPTWTCFGLRQLDGRRPSPRRHCSLHPETGGPGLLQSVRTIDRRVSTPKTQSNPILPIVPSNYRHAREA